MSDLLHQVIVVIPGQRFTVLIPRYALRRAYPFYSTALSSLPPFIITFNFSFFHFVGGVGLIKYVCLSF